MGLVGGLCFKVYQSLLQLACLQLVCSGGLVSR